ncbi:hypothetical protein BC792_10530 [Sphingobacterium allocomposti]|uniref:N-acetylglucosamine kinase-like BadF-type ATPase n=1 Tax=Sphingobacterium allocomposti TaxID=415956 RepID=A0A5S5DKR9_9SPHI|nr:hypothetical protein [Sphingobacterium composti Yoo et al. 2007 non Ten et al. 2007]TYP96543.1 hypothetical protein BC792_10530 [Sphingobacterium composti Yoo et al. 2007 non Ten et al. 2007]HLS96096.1 hypothetical protein [Sphingobacterium sp.]
MIVVVFSGSRYADWRIADKNRVLHGFRTSGINSYIQDERYILQLLNKSNHLINNAEKIRKIYFFGAGASSPDRQEKIERVLAQFFRNAKVKASHDVLASAISTFGDEKGIVGIIGSGSNAAYYNGRKVLPNNYGLGYILADEGSTNWLGRQLLKDFLTETMPSGIREKLLQKYNLDRRLILDRVYYNPNPNLFLTSFADFIYENRDEPYITQHIKKGLEIYIKTYLLPLSESYPDSQFNFTGSVANNYADWLRELGSEYGLHIGSIIKEPVQNLVKYYINKN